jgi:hypothetical protein
MTFSDSSQNIVPAQIGQQPKDLRTALAQSRKTGDVAPSRGPQDVSVTREEGSVTRPWVHFVAGG